MNPLAKRSLHASNLLLCALLLFASGSLCIFYFLPARYALNITQDFENNNSERLAKRSLQICAAGDVMILQTDLDASKPRWHVYLDRHVDSASIDDFSDFKAGKFRYGAAFNAEWITVPIWLVVIVLSSWPFVVYLRYRRDRLRRVAGRCAACGYDLRATPGRCSECGAAAVTS